MNGKNAKHIRRTHQNHVKICIRSFQNHRKSFKNHKIDYIWSELIPGSVQNISKRCAKLWILWKSIEILYVQSWILHDFSWHSSQSNGRPGTARAIAFWRVLARQAMRWIFSTFCHSDTVTDIFRAHFAVILCAFLRNLNTNFAWFWQPV